MRDTTKDSSSMSMEIDEDLRPQQTETFNRACSASVLASGLPAHIVGLPPASEVLKSEHGQWLPERYGLDPSIVTGIPPQDVIRKHRNPTFHSRPLPPAPPPFDQHQITPLLGNSRAVEELYFPNVEHPHINGQPYILEEASEYSRGWKMSRKVDLDKNIFTRRLSNEPPGENASHDPRMCETAAVFHDQESMAQIGGGKALQLAQEIRLLLMGPTESTRDGRLLPGIWTYDWQRNDRSSMPTGTKAGSYSLGTTQSEGKGHGLAIPATQFRSRDANEIRERLNYLVGSLVPLVLEESSMQEEYDSLKFRGEMVNVPGQRAPENRFTTSLQLNMSYSCFTLVDSIGAIQGNLHVDHQDDKAAFTVFILDFFPRCDNDNPGGFCFPEHALYARFTAVCDLVGTREFLRFAPVSIYNRSATKLDVASSPYVGRGRHRWRG
ncbi:hypothetical protein M407DRAFT_24504 [Tulasnella calospora MUT 4182]|uniref:Uncharacterized protein n=1 Tax=Tulasnella calospora MUT 4182 TaxID=1051891 RepID=A0A0C3QHP6_9AGAM|nr:hypothetical protein M407DRAFT_24504 [Tulasnella calospora MUT 4182]